MIKRIKVNNLNRRADYDLTFHPDLNILTGKNGSGKTTLLKLTWYLVSGNFDKMFEELTFDYVLMETDDDSFVEVKITGQEAERKVEFKCVSPSRGINFHSEIPSFNLNMEFPRVQIIESSLFFPTFRRIEGGFSIYSRTRGARYPRGNNIIREALEHISENLTTDYQHKFIASISTEDINYLLSNKYADISENLRKLESQQSREILDIVSKSDDKEKESLQNIRTIVRNNDEIKSEILKPFFILSELVDRIFKDKSIRISNNIELGQAKNAILSDKLSAGEKQMLSFLCYNFFYDNSAIFIDEPELSLHTDWQRMLFPTLLKQNKNNQFFIATHSPFIYSKYPEKEIIITDDKGD
jgi:predicted ATP-dependent endonuclease of OLD family